MTIFFLIIICPSLAVPNRILSKERKKYNNNNALAYNQSNSCT